MNGIESAIEGEIGEALAAASPSNTSPHFSHFVFSKCERETEKAARNAETYIAPQMLSVDLIGPPLLFQGLASLIFGFDEVAHVRLLTDRRTDWPTAPPSCSRPSPLTDYPFAQVRLFWHESLSRANVSLPHCCAALYGNLGEVSLPLPLLPPVTVAFSIDDTPDTLRIGLRAAATGNTFRSPRLPAAAPDSLLSPRECQIIALATEGCTNEAIARQLYLSLSTVKTHLQRAFQKLGVERRTQLRSRLEACGIPLLPSPRRNIVPHLVDGIGDDWVEVWCETKDRSPYTVLLDGLSGF